MSSAGKTYKSIWPSASISQAFYMNFKDIFWRNPVNVCFSNVFRFWLTFPSCSKRFILFLLCYKKLLLLKMPFSTWRKLCCSYYAEKRKIRPKNLAGRKYSVVIIMSVFYQLETLSNGTKNGRQSDYTRHMGSIYPIL